MAGPSSGAAVLNQPAMAEPGSSRSTSAADPVRSEASTETESWPFGAPVRSATRPLAEIAAPATLPIDSFFATSTPFDRLPSATTFSSVISSMSSASVATLIWKSSASAPVLLRLRPAKSSVSATNWL